MLLHVSDAVFLQESLVHNNCCTRRHHSE